ncbi:ABC transporter permease [Sphingosinicella rhizophila]|uniref:ABC transporter permease n=1 Tax=Sphingosinicella rhizophila TaxID=3050082 RepID=A0ABU3Q727_9SPHN|nr:ABC transporter permease [Sphingosinicella sp. GR2756]MDT9599213.1 ABC transporter permease [Sphingosinicella sp. GR2756]
MMGLFQSAYVIGRRDFVATVMSKTFLLFLAGPLLIIGFSVMLGDTTENMARRDTRPIVAVIADKAEFQLIEAARARLNPSFGQDMLPELVHAEPDYVIEGQVKDLLESRDKRILAVLTGGIAKSKLTGAIQENSPIRTRMAMIIEEARQHQAVASAKIPWQPTTVELVRVQESAGSLAASRSLTARTGQLLLFTLTLLLAGMLLSNLIEEKSNKVIEVLAAAVPVDAIFVGKLFGMLAVSLVGITVWTAAAAVGLHLWPLPGGGSLPEPAVGWPLFVLLVLIYYGSSYTLLGAAFLGIGSQAMSIREVQTLSMPITIAQLLFFLFASLAVGPYNSLLGIAAALFPFSSPMAMVARAAQTPELWPHLLALLWQMLWAWLTIKLAASLFRRNVMKSGSSLMPATLRSRRQDAAPAPSPGLK